MTRISSAWAMLSSARARSVTMSGSRWRGLNRLRRWEKESISAATPMTVGQDLDVRKDLLATGDAELPGNGGIAEIALEGQQRDREGKGRQNGGRLRRVGMTNRDRTCHPSGKGINAPFPAAPPADHIGKNASAVEDTALDEVDLHAVEGGGDIGRGRRLGGGVVEIDMHVGENRLDRAEIAQSTRAIRGGRDGSDGERCGAASSTQTESPLMAGSDSGGKPERSQL